MKGDFTKKNRAFWVFPTISLTLFLLSLSFLFLSSKNRTFADFLSRGLSHYISRLLSGASGIFPFSLFELFAILSLPAAVFLTVLAYFKIDSLRTAARGSIRVLGFISLALSLYFLSFGIGYKTSPLEEKMGLSCEAYDAELSRFALYSCQEARRLSEELIFSEGESVSGYSLKELGDRLSAAFSSLGERTQLFRSYKSRPKPMLLSRLMTKIGIKGVYSYLTGEAAVNECYPDWSVVFTAAHEMAHQRGFFREEEAGFIGYLACLESEDPYINYCGHLGVLEYLLPALYERDRESYSEAIKSLGKRARVDLVSALSLGYSEESFAASHTVGDLNRGRQKMSDSDTKGYKGMLSLALCEWKRREAEGHP